MIFRRRSYVIHTGISALVSLIIIFFAGALFTALDYDFAVLTALSISLILFFTAVERASIIRSEPIRDIIWSLTANAVIAVMVPMLIGSIHAVLRGQIDIIGGAVMYLAVTVPVTVSSMFFGIRFGLTPRTPLRRRLRAVIFWISTLILALLPGYFTNQLYSYGWQFGFFPGFVWDDHIQLGSRYWLSQGWLILCSMVLLLDAHIADTRSVSTFIERLRIRQRLYKTKPLILLLYAALGTGFYFTGFILSEHSLQDTLPITLTSHLTNIRTDTTLSHDEQKLLLRQMQRDREYIAAVAGNGYEVKLDLYPSEEMLGEMIGTRTASIAKPWRGSISMAYENIASLRHELVHIALARYGSFPFGISWSTGLTEGIAVALEDNYDGIRDCDEYAARILQLGLADGVQQVMSFSGFASETSGKSYTLAGSFCKYLLRRYGSAAFLKLYGSNNYIDTYGKSLTDLEREWIASLRQWQTPMTRFDSLRTRFYFDRKSIISEIDLRGLGRMMHKADMLFAEKEYTAAEQIYAAVMRSSDRLDAVRARILCRLRTNDVKGALSILNELRSERPNTALHILRGDCYFLSGDTSHAMMQWRTALDLELSERQTTSAFIRCYYLSRIECDSARTLLRKLYYGKKLTANDLPSFATEMHVDNKNYHAAKCALLFTVFLSQGQIQNAYKAAKLGISFTDTSTRPDDRYQRILAKRFADFINETSGLFPADLQPPVK